MKTMLRNSAMLVVTLGLAMMSAAGQTSAAGGNASKPATPDRFDLGIAFTYKVAQISNTSQERFVMPGGAVDGVFNLKGRFRNLGLAFDFNAEEAKSIQPGVNLSQVTFVAGPRYTWHDSSPRCNKLGIYGQALVGEVHAFNSLFPSSNGVNSSASSFALQLGGGVNLQLTRSMGLRLLEADYVTTKLPNGTNSFQGDMRMSNGLTFRF